MTTYKQTTFDDLIYALQRHPRLGAYGTVIDRRLIQPYWAKGYRHILDLPVQDYWKNPSVNEAYGIDSCYYVGAGVYLFKNPELATLVKLERG